MKNKVIKNLKQAQLFIRNNKGRLDCNIVELKNKILIEYKEIKTENIFKK